MNPKDLEIEDYNYDLPKDRIAEFPLDERDESKLLIWQKGVIANDIYKNIAQYIPESSVLVFNDSKVIPARILFKKNTGSIIEIFCLEPYLITDYNVVMNSTSSSKWNCLVGGISKWKSSYLEKNFLIGRQTVTLKATWIDKGKNTNVIEFNWTPTNFSFSEIIENAGELPLPPYIKRKPDPNDRIRYQTIFAKENGSVAAPTAALHFTDRILLSLKEKNVQINNITLHVGGGTFKPVKSKTMQDHEMHAECIEVQFETIKFFLENADKPITSVGTTTARTLESLYWMGIKSLQVPNRTTESLSLKQWDTYDIVLSTSISKKMALNSLLKYMVNHKLDKLIVQTQILIAPGYKFKMTDILITNFHQPKSTLLLLIAAAIGKEWKFLYNYALKNNFRFLSYGDGCLLHIEK